MAEIDGFLNINSWPDLIHLGRVGVSGIGSSRQVNTAGIRGIAAGCRCVDQVFGYGGIVIVNQCPCGCQRLAAADQGQVVDVDSEITIINRNVV